MTNTTNSSTLSLTGKVALVTGGSRGIGRAVALRLGRSGAHVAVNYVNNKEAADKVVAEIAAAGGKAAAIQADTSKLADIRRLFDEVIQRFDRLDIAVLAPGAFVMKPVVEISEEEYDRVFSLNTKGVFFTLQEAARRIADGGAIVSLSSGATAMPNAGGSVYAGSKSAAEHFTFALAKELGKRNVSVNTVSPGVTNTDGLVAPPQFIEYLKTQIPYGRIGEPEEVASVVAFLVSPEGHWINGQNVRANGGIV